MVWSSILAVGPTYGKSSDGALSAPAHPGTTLVSPCTSCQLLQLLDVTVMSVSNAHLLLIVHHLHWDGLLRTCFNPQWSSCCSLLPVRNSNSLLVLQL